MSHENRFASPFPIYIERADGPPTWDVDGNEYIDYSMGSASLLLGHACPTVVKALQDQAAKGTFFSNCRLASTLLGVARSIQEEGWVWRSARHPSRFWGTIAGRVVLMKRRLQASGTGRQHSRAATESRFEVLLAESARRDDPDYRLAQLRRDSVGGFPLERRA